MAICRFENIRVVSKQIILTLKTGFSEHFSYSFSSARLRFEWWFFPLWDPEISGYSSNFSLMEHGKEKWVVYTLLPSMSRWKFEYILSLFSVSYRIGLLLEYIKTQFYSVRIKFQQQPKTFAPKMEFIAQRAVLVTTRWYDARIVLWRSSHLEYHLRRPDYFLIPMI